MSSFDLSRAPEFGANNPGIYTRTYSGGEEQLLESALCEVTSIAPKYAPSTYEPFKPEGFNNGEFVRGLATNCVGIAALTHLYLAPNTSIEPGIICVGSTTPYDAHFMTGIRRGNPKDNTLLDSTPNGYKTGIFETIDLSSLGDSPEDTVHRSTIQALENVGPEDKTTLRFARRTIEVELGSRLIRTTYKRLLENDEEIDPEIEKEFAVTIRGRERSNRFVDELFRQHSSLVQETAYN